MPRPAGAGTAATAARAAPWGGARPQRSSRALAAAGPTGDGPSTSGRPPLPPRPVAGASHRRGRAPPPSTTTTTPAAIHTPGGGSPPPALAGGDDDDGGLPPPPPTPPATAPPPPGIAFLMRSVLDADTIPDLAKRKLLAAGRARGLDFERLVAASMWDEATGVVARADGAWPAVEGFEAAAAAAAAGADPPPDTATAYVPALDWRSPAAVPANLDEALGYVAAEAAFTDRGAAEAAAEAYRRELGLGEPTKEADARAGADDDDDPVTALERRLMRADGGEASTSGGAKKGFGGGGKAKPSPSSGGSKKKGRGRGRSVGPPISEKDAVPVPGAFIAAGANLELAVDWFMGVRTTGGDEDGGGGGGGDGGDGRDGASPASASASDLRSADDDVAIARDLAVSVAVMLGILVDPDMEHALEDPYESGNFREGDGGGRGLGGEGDVVDVGPPPVPSRAAFDPAVAEGFLASVRAARAAVLEEEARAREAAAAAAAAAEAERAAAAEAAAQAAAAAAVAVSPEPSTATDGDPADVIERERAEIVAAMAELAGVEGGARPRAPASSQGDGAAPMPQPQPPPPAPPAGDDDLTGQERRRARRAAARAAAAGASIGDAAAAAMLVTAPAPDPPPAPPARQPAAPAHASSRRDETGARPPGPGGKPRELTQVKWDRAVGYILPSLRPAERAGWKAAGVLLYTFDPYGELMLLLGRTFMGGGGGGGRSDGGEPGPPRPARPPVLRAWNLLGGKRKVRDATAEATAIRELVEETGGLVTPDMLRGPLTPVLWYPTGGYAAFPYCLPPGEAAYALPDRFAQRLAVGRASIPASGRDTGCLEWVRLSSILSGRRRVHVFMEAMLQRTRLMDWLKLQQQQYWASTPRPLRVRGGGGGGSGGGGGGEAARRGGLPASTPASDPPAPPPLPPGRLHWSGGGGGDGPAPALARAVARRPPALHAPDAPDPVVVTPPPSSLAAQPWPPREGVARPPLRPRTAVSGSVPSPAMLAAAAGPLAAASDFLPTAGGGARGGRGGRRAAGAGGPPPPAMALGPAAAAAFLPPLVSPPPRRAGEAAASPATAPQPFAVVHMPAASQAGEAVAAASQAQQAPPRSGPLPPSAPPRNRGGRAPGGGRGGGGGRGAGRGGRGSSGGGFVGRQQVGGDGSGWVSN